jgi:AraC family transcriptional regulator of adaptative response / DNA-3-methyladenine glycosylase II
MLPPDQCYAAMQSRDRRFDGLFVAAVATTGIYCRPSCPARTPRRAVVTFFPTAAAAEQAGYRPCKRCRPEAAPGAAGWTFTHEVARRALQLIDQGVADQGGVAALARRLDYSPRQLQRVLTAELGAGPAVLARTRRAQLARLLLDAGNLSLTDVAMAAGFSSVSQFNATMRRIYGVPPSRLRRSGTRSPEVIRLALSYRPPLAWLTLQRFLARRAVPGLEEAPERQYRRVLVLPHGLGVGTVHPPDGQNRLILEQRLPDLRDLPQAVAAWRRLLDLDADPVAVGAGLTQDAVLAQRWQVDPGRRVPGTVDPHELAIRAVLGQQVSLAAARALAARLVATLGPALPAPDGGLTRGFPPSDHLAQQDPDRLPLPRRRARTVVALAEALATGRIRLGPEHDRETAYQALLAIDGIGPWTAAYIMMRAFGHPDAFQPSDLGVRKAFRRLGWDTRPSAVAQRAEAWRPWRAYAQMYLGDGSAPPEGGE